MLTKLRSGYMKTSINALRLYLEPVIYKSKFLDSKFFTSLVFDAFLKANQKIRYFLGGTT